MYERSALLFIYTDAPLHLGAGVSFGAVDLPIQRERHTRYPMIQGSGLKGALRHHVAWTAKEDSGLVKWIFGPDGGDEGRPQDHAGAAAFGDGKLLLFPVRSLAGTFAYGTSSLALARLRRDVAIVSGQEPRWPVPEDPAEGRCVVPPGSAVVVKGKVVLEDFDLEVKEDQGLRDIASWIAETALPAEAGFAPFRKRVQTHLVLLPENLFKHLTELATVVEPHVRIDDDKGTASEGGFFYAEHLPPDALLWSLVGISRPRTKNEEKDQAAELGLTGAEAVEETLRKWFDSRAVQLGAEATTGRGLVHLRLRGR